VKFQLVSDTSFIYVLTVGGLAGFFAALLVLKERFNSSVDRHRNSIGGARERTSKVENCICNFIGPDETPVRLASVKLSTFFFCVVGGVEKILERGVSVDLAFGDQ